MMISVYRLKFNNKYFVTNIWLLLILSCYNVESQSDSIYFPEQYVNQHLNGIPNNNYQTAQQLPAIDYDTRFHQAQNSVTTDNFITDFSWNLFKGSTLPNRYGNLVLSPILPQILLSLLQSAAYGATSDQIGEAIRNPDPKTLTDIVNQLKQTKSRNEFQLASVVFAANDLLLNDSFNREAVSRFINVKKIDFNSNRKAANTINQWVSETTRHTITNVINAESIQGARLILASAMYFRGFWKYPFNTTEPGFFEVNEQEQKRVSYMKNKLKLRASEFTLQSGETGQWVELPYEGRNEFSMIFILPTQKHTLNTFIRNLNTKDLTDIFAEIDDSYTRLVHLRIPKFSVESSFSIRNTLLKLKLVDLFTPLSQLPYLTTNNEPLKVDDVVQKGTLQIDETGSVASATATISVVTLSLSEMPKDLYFDATHPFVAIVYDKRNKCPLFISKIFNPYN